jgi:hypothetical protein
MKNALKLNNNLVMFLLVKISYFIENKYFLFFILATIEEESLSDVYDRICEVIDHEETVNRVWVPSKEKV